VRLTLLGLFLCCCSDLALPDRPARAQSTVEVEPVGERSAAPAVLRLRVPGGVGRSALADYRLFGGSLSSYYLRKLAARDVPASLMAREIGVIAWAEGLDVVVAPTRALDAGVVSLATPELGLVGSVTVNPGLVPWLARRWPPASEGTGNGFAVFCGEAAASVSEGPVLLEPAGMMAELHAGIDGQAVFADGCASIEPTSPGALAAPALPPPLAGGVGFEPLPLVAVSAASPPPSCDSAETRLGPACALVDDDRVVLRAPSEPSLWALVEPTVVLGVSAPGASLVVHGLEPGSPVLLRGAAFDRAGVRTSIDASLTGAARHAHVVINEVLANPRGPESVSEWLEVVNDGASAADLTGFELRDGGGAVSLPAARLEPGELVLLVAAGFALDPELDVPPAPGTRVLPLATLGQAGLSNSGELLRLSDADGRVLSRFPALAASAPGISLARRTPDAPDAEAASFGAHAAPGASPGAPNELAAAR